MTKIVLGPTGTKRRRWSLLAPLFLVALVGLILTTGAGAVHDLATGQQLDGDVSNACPAGLATCTAAQKDWADLFTVTDTPTPAPGTESVDVNTAVVGATGSPYTTASFVRDFESGTTTANCAIDSLATTKFCTGDDTTFATGSKDTLDITGWQCNHDNNVNSKIDIMNAYAASYTIPAGQPNAGDKVLYFGMEKNKDNGTNDVGFWFLQGSASCEAPSGHQDFVGTHTIGDVLIVSEFTNGGGVSNITAYRWVGGPNPLVVFAQASGNGGDCKTALGADVLCATTNSGPNPFNTTIDTPWLSADATLGVGKTGKIVPPDFFEGGIDITRAFAIGGGGAAPSCFNTFIGDTRSSATLTATLFDFALGNLGECKTELSTQENAAASREIPASGSITSGTDTATLEIKGSPTWTGDLTWYLCGPGVTTCDNTGFLVTTTPVANTDAQCTGTPLVCTYVSGTVNVTSAASGGGYCWHAHFEPSAASKAAGVPSGDDDGTNECFTITPKTPTLSTAADCSGASPCVLGSTLRDFATLGNTANNPDPANPGSDADFPTIGGGTKAADSSITWQLFGPDTSGNAQCTTPIANAPSPSSIQVSGNNTYGPVSYTTLSTDRVGKYTFAASYLGEAPNTLAATAVACDLTGANGEQVTVIGAASSSSQQGWLPNDRVTLNSTAGTTLHGTLSIKLYQGAFTGTLANCGAGSATLRYTQPDITVNTAGNTGTFNTTNSTFFVGVNPSTGAAGGTDGNYFWLIHYDDNSLTDPADRCESATISHNDG